MYPSRCVTLLLSIQVGSWSRTKTCHNSKLLNSVSWVIQLAVSRPEENRKTSLACESIGIFTFFFISFSPPPFSWIYSSLRCWQQQSTWFLMVPQCLGKNTGTDFSSSLLFPGHENRKSFLHSLKQQVWGYFCLLRQGKKRNPVISKARNNSYIYQIACERLLAAISVF